jgi:hypothetical protein
MKALRLLSLAFCAILAVAAARATTVIPPSFDQLVGQAQLIFEGTVTEVKSEWAGEGGQRRIVSYITFKVDDPLKGNPGTSYTIRMLGGTVGDETMEVSDSPKFKVGDRDILFVENNGTQFIPLVGIMHGRYRVETDKASGEEVVLTNRGEALSDVKQLGKEDMFAHAGHGHGHAAGGSEKAMQPSEFKAAIKSKLAADAQQ